MRRMKKLVAVALAAIMAGSVGLPAGAEAAQTKSFSDTREHWAKEYIQSGVTRGYISGYEDGTFQPDLPVTRAEFCKMANNALGITQTASINFKDVSSSNWYYQEVRKAVSAGYISGYEDNTFRPNAPITRQEAAVVLSRVVAPAATEKSIYDFRDGSAIDSWAQSGARMVYTKDYMSGDDNRRFNPKGNLTRGESAKIVEKVLQGESIEKSNLTISTPQTVSNGLYIGNVTLASGLGNGDVTFRNCRILGTLTVSGGDEVSLSHTGVHKLVVNRSAGEPEISVSGNSRVKQTTVNVGCDLTESNLTGEGFVDVTLTGSNLRNADVFLRGAFDGVNINSQSKLSLESGGIAALTIASGGAGSQIYLEDNTRVTSAYVAGSADFTGEGRISNANITVSGVTFETPPDDGSGYLALTPAVTPKNKATEVSVNTKITLAFQDILKNDQGKEITRSYVEDEVVELRSGKETGSRLDFTASLSNSNRTITLYPSDTLEKSTTYYVILLKKSLRNNSGTYNERQVYYFTTVGGLTPVTNPVDGSDTISVGTNITLTFDSALLRGDTKGNISGDYLNTYCLSLNRGSSSGKSVAVTSTISDDRKTITINPNGDLDTGTQYYVTIRENSLATSSGLKIKEQVFDFTTADSSALVPAMDPPTGSEDVVTNPTITLSFQEQLYTYSGSSTISNSDLESAFTLYRRSNTSSNRVGMDISINSARRVITIKPEEKLLEDSKYYLLLNKNSFSDHSSGSGRNNNIEMTFQFTTGSSSSTESLIPTAAPKNGATGVSTGGAIQLYFDSRIYTSEGDSVTSSYLQSDVLELRESSATGSKIGFSTTVDGRIVTITPSGSLRTNTKYYVIVKADTLKNTTSSSSGDTNQKFTTYFTTGSSGTVLQATSPQSGATNVGNTESIVLNYSQSLYTATNGSLYNSYIYNGVKLYEGTKEGTNAISFSSGTSSNSGKTLTLTPKQALKDNTTYMLVIPAGTFSNAAGALNSKQSFTFTVGSGISITLTNPTNNATNVGRMENIVLTFGETVKRPNNETLDVTYLTSNIQLYRGSISSSNAVSVTPSLNDRTVTLTPSEALSAGTLYYVVIPANAFKGITRENNVRFQASFTTSSAVLTPTMTPANNATDVPVHTNLVFQFPETVKDKNKEALTASYVKDSVFVIYEGTSGSTTIDGGFVATVDNEANARKITLTPGKALKASTDYRVVLKANTLSTTGGTKNTQQTFTFRTQAITPVKAPTVTFVDSSASIPEKLKLTFATGVTQAKDGSPLTVDFIAENFALWEGEPGGVEQDFTVTASSTAPNTVFILTPTFDSSGGPVTIQSLKPVTKYFLTASAGILKNSTGGTNEAVNESVETKAPQVTIETTLEKDTARATIKFDYQCTFDVVLKEGESQTTLISMIPGTPFSSFTEDLSLKSGVNYTLEVNYSYNDKSGTVTKGLWIAPPSNNTALKAEAFGVTAGGTFYPATGSGETYTVTGVPEGPVKIWAEAEDAAATVTINEVAGPAGVTTYTIVVTAEDGTPQTYTLTVTAE